MSIFILILFFNLQANTIREGKIWIIIAFKAFLLQESCNCTTVTVVYMAENGRVDRYNFSLQRLWQKKVITQNKQKRLWIFTVFIHISICKKTAVMSWEKLLSKIACPLHVNETVKIQSCWNFSQFKKKSHTLGK